MRRSKDRDSSGRKLQFMSIVWLFSLFLLSLALRRMLWTSQCRGTPMHDALWCTASSYAYHSFLTFRIWKCQCISYYDFFCLISEFSLVSNNVWVTVICVCYIPDVMALGIIAYLSNRSYYRLDNSASHSPDFCSSHWSEAGVPGLNIGKRHIREKLLIVLMILFFPVYPAKGYVICN